MNPEELKKYHGTIGGLSPLADPFRWAIERGHVDGARERISHEYEYAKDALNSNRKAYMQCIADMPGSIFSAMGRRIGAGFYRGFFSGIFGFAPNIVLGAADGVQLELFYMKEAMRSAEYRLRDKRQLEKLATDLGVKLG